MAFVTGRTENLRNETWIWLWQSAAKEGVDPSESELLMRDPLDRRSLFVIKPAKATGLRNNGRIVDLAVEDDLADARAYLGIGIDVVLLSRARRLQAKGG